MPESIGRCADLYHDVRDLRLAMQKEVEVIEAREKEIKEYIVANLSKSLDSGAAGLRYRAQIIKKVVPRIADWAALTAAIQATGRFDMLQKRLSDKAVAGVWDEGGEVPGVERFNSIDVSITKIGK